MLSKPTRVFLEAYKAELRQLAKEMEPRYPPLFKPSQSQGAALESWVYQSGQFEEFVRWVNVLTGETNMVNVNGIDLEKFNYE